MNKKNKKRKTKKKINLLISISTTNDWKEKIYREIKIWIQFLWKYKQELPIARILELIFVLPQIQPQYAML